MERLTTNRDWSEARRDLGQELGYSHIWKRLNTIEDILGDDYDLDRLKEIVEADREGRLEIKVKARRCPKCGKFQLYPRIDWNYYYCFHCKTQFTKDEAEAALRRMQDEGVH